MTDETKNLLRSLVNSKQWQALVNMAEETTVDIKKDSVLKDTPDETYKEVYLQEGQVRGIKRFIDNIFNTIK
jgi:hypothetical protein